MRRALVLHSVLMGLATAGCGGDQTTAPGQPALSDPLTVVPFAAAISGIRVQAANDSLDVLEHHGRTYLAFRTSASWFADVTFRIGQAGGSTVHRLQISF